MWARVLPAAPVLLLSIAGAASAEEERLVLLGGGRPPPAALARFVQWAGGARARILVLPWAADDGRDAVDSVRDALRPFSPGVVEAAPAAPLRDDGPAELRRRLDRASAVFLAGGNQQRLLDVLADDEVAGALRARYRDGVAFAGSSAGTAAISALAITGEGDFTVIDARQVQVRAGLALLPGVILDQHFIRRQRQNRLFALVLAHPRLLGVGIDEGAALLVRAGRHAEAVGGPVMAVDGRHRGELRVYVLNAGDTFDLEKRKRGRAGSRLSRNRLDLRGGTGIIAGQWARSSWRSCSPDPPHRRLPPSPRKRPLPGPRCSAAACSRSRTPRRSPRASSRRR